MNAWVDQKLRIPRKDLLPESTKLLESLVQHAKRVAADAGAHWQFLQGKKTSKERRLGQLARERKHGDRFLFTAASSWSLNLTPVR